ncbi:MAG: hypothetical protein QOE61_1915 [Micromonosporaceae bacterium]|jgi:hypothetical protein|nr:hypothetical protein [Micromonosporaceae bacterium]
MPPHDRLGTRRLAAWIVDWLIVSIYPAALVPIGLLLTSRSFTLPSLAWNLVTFAGLIAPVTLWLAWWEYTRAATPGKRLLHLRVAPGHQGGEPASLTAGSIPDQVRQPVDRHERPSARKALARNALKVALPWEVAHTGIFILTDAGAGGAVRGFGTGCIAAAYLFGLWYVISLFAGSRRAPYDVATGLSVRGSASREYILAR